MSPVVQFEESARTIWRSKMSLPEKGAKLRRVRSAIVQYVGRLDEKRASSASDPWTARSYDRVRNYLVHLASDVENLSLECERNPKASKKGVTSLFAD